MTMYASVLAVELRCTQIHSYRIASYLHRVPIFTFFARQNNLVKINSYERTRIDRTTLKWFYTFANKACCTCYSNNQVHEC